MVGYLKNDLSFSSDYVMKPVNRKDNIDDFMSWLKVQGVDTSCVSIHEYEYGLGLRAEREIEVVLYYLLHIIAFN